MAFFGTRPDKVACVFHLRRSGSAVDALLTRARRAGHCRRRSRNFHSCIHCALAAAVHCQTRRCRRCAATRATLAMLSEDSDFNISTWNSLQVQFRRDKSMRLRAFTFLSSSCASRVRGGQPKAKRPKCKVPSVGAPPRLRSPPRQEAQRLQTLNERDTLRRKMDNECDIKHCLREKRQQALRVAACLWRQTTKALPRGHLPVVPDKEEQAAAAANRGDAVDAVASFASFTATGLATSASASATSEC